MAEQGVVTICKIRITVGANPKVFTSQQLILTNFLFTFEYLSLIMIRRIYIDTSVIGGYYDLEFEVATRKLFERIKNGDFI